MNDGFITWNDGDDAGKAEAMSKFGDSVDAYQGVQKSTARHDRTYINVEPNVSVRPEFGKSDYYAFRPDERPASDSRSESFSHW